MGEKQNLHPFALFRFRDLMEMKIVGNRMTLGRWIARGDFPKGIKIGPNSIAWKAADIQAWLERRSGGNTGEAA